MANPRLSDEEHQRRGTYRRDRHAEEGADDEPVDRHGDAIDPQQLVSEADRARVLRGLPTPAHQIADALLNLYWNFDPAAQFTLRCYALSCARLEALQTARPLSPAKVHAEIAANLALAAALKLG